MNLNNQSSILDINTNVSASQRFGGKSDGGLMRTIFLQGCYTTVTTALKTHSPIVGGLLLTVALVPLLGSILACALIRHMGKHRYEPVD